MLKNFFLKKQVYCKKKSIIHFKINIDSNKKKQQMPKQKNLGPCVISGCENAVKFNKMTNYTIEKIRNKDSERKYDFIKEGDQLCYMHYLEIVEPDRNDKDKKDNNKLKRRSGESLNIEYS